MESLVFFNDTSGRNMAVLKLELLSITLTISSFCLIGRRNLKVLKDFIYMKVLLVNSLMPRALHERERGLFTNCVTATYEATAHNQVASINTIKHQKII